MRLSHLEISNFRNYKNQAVEPGEFLNILSGQNAQGKTNFIEAVQLSCSGKSFRTLRDSEMITDGALWSRLLAVLETNSGRSEIEVVLRPGEKKFRKNGKPAPVQPLGWPGIVLFTPDDLNMVSGSPQERRRFLDEELGPLSPRYSYFLKRYNKALLQRNYLLREIRAGRKKKVHLFLGTTSCACTAHRLLEKELHLLPGSAA